MLNASSRRVLPSSSRACLGRCAAGCPNSAIAWEPAARETGQVRVAGRNAPCAG